MSFPATCQCPGRLMTVRTTVLTNTHRVARACDHTRVQLGCTSWTSTVAIMVMPHTACGIETSHMPMSQQRQRRLPCLSSVQRQQPPSVNAHGSHARMHCVTPRCIAWLSHISHRFHAHGTRHPSESCRATTPQSVEVDGSFDRQIAFPPTYQ